MTGQKLAGLVLIGAGIGSGILWASGRVTQAFAPVVALLLFLAGASFLGKTSRFVEELRPFVGKNVRVRVWGSELPDDAGSGFSVHMVQAFGAGLHIYLRPWPHGSLIHLKVAQPLGTTISDMGVEIGDAKYVQWAGSKITKAEREKAVVLAVVTEEFSIEKSGRP